MLLSAVAAVWVAASPLGIRSRATLTVVADAGTAGNVASWFVDTVVDS